MNTILRRSVSVGATGSAKPEKFAAKLFVVAFGEGLGAAFAVGVMLGALWLLVSGYV